MWKKTKINGYWVEAKVYETGSEYGIEGGRVSKLAIRRRVISRYSDRLVLVVSYDRGWDIRPTTETQEIYKKAMEWAVA